MGHRPADGGMGRVLGAAPGRDSVCGGFVITISEGRLPMNRYCFWLTKERFARLRPLLPTDTRGKPRVDDRRVISGIVHVLKSGGRWVDDPRAVRAPDAGGAPIVAAADPELR